MKLLNGKKQEIMAVLWEAEEPLSAYQISQQNPQLKMPTIRRSLEELLKEGNIQVAGSVMSGRVYARAYSPVLSKEEYLRGSALESRIKPVELMAAMLDDEKLDSETLDRLQQMIELKKKELGE